jgi:hypothetical protein
MVLTCVEGESQPYIVLDHQKQTVLMLQLLQPRFHCVQLLHPSEQRL